MAFISHETIHKTVSLSSNRMCFDLIVNSDYDQRKGTRFITIEPHADEILIVLVVNGMQARGRRKDRISYVLE